jgi:hypothetical protein
MEIVFDPQAFAASIMQSTGPAPWGKISPFVVAVVIFLVVAKVIKGAIDGNRQADEAERQASEARRQTAEAERRAAEERRLQQYRSKQESYLDELIALSDRSLLLFEKLPASLDAAERFLYQANIDFAEGVFAPFWDSIENAARALGEFNQHIQGIQVNSLRYSELMRVYEGKPPAFPVQPQSVAKLGVGGQTSDRMRDIVRKAQRNFQFATIYEQRKTNQILIAGFQNLAQALNSMTQSICASISNLANSVDAMSSSVYESSNAMRAELGRIATANARIAEANDKILRESADRFKRERRVLEMLDNIQRGRKPFF